MAFDVSKLQTQLTDKIARKNQLTEELDEVQTDIDVLEIWIEILIEEQQTDKE